MYDMFLDAPNISFHVYESLAMCPSKHHDLWFAFLN